MPLYEHDCKACRFLGTEGPLKGEPRCNGVDMYICTQGREPEDYALIRRYSSEDSNYGCMPMSYEGERYASNRRLAKLI